MHCKLQIR